MRKAFRMKYEPCNGMCYVAPEVVDLSSLADDPEQLKEITRKLLQAHEPICGNENYSYGLDYDEKNELFIGSFIHFGKLELYSSKELITTLHQLCDDAISFFASDIGKQELSEHPGLGHSVCKHGEDDDLLKFMIEHSGIPTPNGIEAFIEQTLR